MASLRIGLLVMCSGMPEINVFFLLSAEAYSLTAIVSSLGRFYSGILVVGVWSIIIIKMID